MPHINLSAAPHFQPGPNLPHNPPTAWVVPQPEYTRAGARSEITGEPSFRDFWAAAADLVAQFTGGTSGPAGIMSVPFVYDNVATENL